MQVSICERKLKWAAYKSIRAHFQSKRNEKSRGLQVAGFKLQVKNYGKQGNEDTGYKLPKTSFKSQDPDRIKAGEKRPKRTNFPFYI